MERDQEETKTKVARQHLSPPERKEHISERSPRMKCFENRQDWRTLISRSADSNSGEYP